MTYRVVHINTSPISGGATPTLSVSGDATPSGLLNGSAVSAAGADHAQMAYIATSTGSPTEVSLSPAAGGFYVIGSAQDMMHVAAAASGSSSASSLSLAGTRLRQTASSAAGAASSAASSVLELPRVDRRRATHNEVERRRRDKINNWIAKLAKILPDATGSGDLSKGNLSKGAVLAQACDFIAESRNYHAKYVEAARENDKLHEDIKMLKQSNEALVTANQLLKAHLKNQGALLLEPSESSRNSP